MPKSGTREKLLDAAEHSFAEQTFSGASMRDIAKRADVNLSSIGYHFGTKAGMLEAVLTRRFKPLVTERMQALKVAKIASGAAPPTLRSIVRSYLEPSVRIGLAHPSFVFLLCHLWTEPRFREIKKSIDSLTNDCQQEFRAVLVVSLPELRKVDLDWALSYLQDPRGSGVSTLLASPSA
ncbi:MAG: TetR family transcriptional regulator [Planctomycetota bacterium]